MTTFTRRFVLLTAAAAALGAAKPVRRPGRLPAPTVEAGDGHAVVRFTPASAKDKPLEYEVQAL